jgi:putative transposase
MARTNDALSVEDVLATGGGMQGLKDVLSTVVQDALQELIEAEVTARLGAGRWERSEDRSGVRNGSRPRTVSTPAGDVEVKIPKLRKGSFFPDLLEPRRRVDRALWGVIMTAYVTGTSTRKVDDLVKALGCDSGVSKSTVSRICADIDREVAPVRKRPLSHVALPYVFVDATYIKARIGHHVVSRAVVIATGVIFEGSREALDADVGDSEGEVLRRSHLCALPSGGRCTSGAATARADYLLMPVRFDAAPWIDDRDGPASD